jgi:hypothetical protein
MSQEGCGRRVRELLSRTRNRGVGGVLASAPLGHGLSIGPKKWAAFVRGVRRCARPFLISSSESPVGRGFYRRLSAGTFCSSCGNFQKKPRAASRSVVNCRPPIILAERNTQSMRKHLIALVAVIALVTLGGSVLAHAQTANRPAAASKTFGYQDSKTGAFHPLGTTPEIADATAPTSTFSGTIEVTVTITLKTALPKGGTVACTVGASVISESETTDAVVGISETGSSIATVSGSTATCKVNIPYSWVLFTNSATVINTLSGSLDVIMYSPITTSIADFTEDVAREHSQAITINAGKPGDGTETVTAAVTL